MAQLNTLTMSAQLPSKETLLQHLRSVGTPRSASEILKWLKSSNQVPKNKSKKDIQLCRTLNQLVKDGSIRHEGKFYSAVLSATSDSGQDISPESRTLTQEPNDPHTEQRPSKETLLQYLRSDGKPHSAADILQWLKKTHQVAEHCAKNDIQLSQTLRQLVVDGSVQHEGRNYMSTSREKTAIDDVKHVLSQFSSLAELQPAHVKRIGLDTGDRYQCTVELKLLQQPLIVLVAESSPEPNHDDAKIKAYTELLRQLAELKLNKKNKKLKSLRRAAKDKYYVAHRRGCVYVRGHVYPIGGETSHLEFKGAPEADEEKWLMKAAELQAKTKAKYFAYALNTCMKDPDKMRSGSDPRMVLGVHDSTKRMHGVFIPFRDRLGVDHLLDYHAEKLHVTVTNVLAEKTGTKCRWKEHTKCVAHRLHAPDRLAKQGLYAIFIIYIDSEKFFADEFTQQELGLRPDGTLSKLLSFGGEHPKIRDGSHASKVPHTMVR